MKTHNFEKLEPKFYSQNIVLFKVNFEKIDSLLIMWTLNYAKQVHNFVVIIIWIKNLIKINKTIFDNK